MPSRHDRLARRSRRLRGRDYARRGDYFVTLCVDKKAHLLGRIVEKAERLNAAGRMVRHWWLRIPTKFPGVEPGAFVVMPNHVHGILRIRGGASALLGDVIRWFKTMTTNAYIRGVRDHGWSSYERRFWQRNYFDRIIRDADEYMRAERYIAMNPARWWWDSLNPRA